MDISTSDLEYQYTRAIRLWPFIHKVEANYRLRRFILIAVGSRETNLDPYYVDNPGDGGHGNGLWQLDDRSWDIPNPFPVELQAAYAASLLANLIHSENGDLVRAFNRYNSGTPNTGSTTGKNYGPDVLERLQYLADRFPPAEPAIERKRKMFIGYNSNWVGLFFDGEKVFDISGPDAEELKKTRNGSEGVPEFGVLSDDFWHKLGAPDTVITMERGN